MLNEITNNMLLSYTIVFVLGLAIGSFLNVVIYRLPIILDAKYRREYEIFLGTKPKKSLKEKIFNLFLPRSHCPECQTTLAPQHNIPLLSFIFLQGKCARCLEPISWRYPIVEFCTALLSVLLFFYFGWSLSLLAALLLCWSLIALALIDHDTQMLPDEITLPLLWLGLLFNTATIFTTPENAIFGAIAGYAALWIIAKLFLLLRKKEGLGYGDFKLCAVFGAWLGWQMLPLILLIASLFGGVYGLTLIALKKHHAENPIPFGPFLALAGILVLLYGKAILHLYLGVIF